MKLKIWLAWPKAQEYAHNPLIIHARTKREALATAKHLARELRGLELVESEWNLLESSP